MPDFKAGDITWKECSIENALGDKIEILGLLVEINIYQDIYVPFMTGTALIVDTWNLLSRFPLLGEEKLHLEFKTPWSFTRGEETDNNEVKKTFRIYKVDSRSSDINKATYNFHFISEEAAVDATTQLSLPFKGNGDKIIEDVLKIHLKSEKQKIITPTGNKLQFVSCFWSPSRIIKYVTDHSIASTPMKQADYVFFESTTAFHFASLNDLKKLKTKNEYYLSQSLNATMGPDNKSGVPDANSRMFSILDVRFDVHVDWLKRIYSRGYTHHSMIHDLTFKTVDYLKYDIADSYEKYNHLGGEITGTEKNEDADKNPHFITPKLKPPQRLQDYYTDVVFSANRSYDELKEDYSGLAKHLRAPMLAQMEFMKFDVDLWGDCGLKVGDNIWINFGKQTSVITDQKWKERLDPVLTGKYMVSAMIHRLAPTQHLMTLQVVKDGVGTDLQKYAKENYPQFVVTRKA